ncbi:uncharacterized protein TRAVEDRAFT_48145 [Trametes versicolor FP-101664 SS1]|uniref:uncharacterized protein n=1 Tax=Trametes versicolor (strain FP-101664) TaxID=717944 RepID=UPI0004621BB8|nr:uncharacterized protein TRAVEDRAFT_48145 [Trametes versicolor FP-101664 SS1]EIW59018.1 hypothetical protein TRAVEDRAFT_48145 [Trametes versicolor FP-101664 SS1]
MSSMLLPNTAAQILRKRSTPWPFHAAQSMRTLQDVLFFVISSFVSARAYLPD